MGYRKNWFIRLLDRVLSGGVWQQIGLLTAFIASILVFFILIAWVGGSELFGVEGCEDNQGLWGVYYHFVDAGNQYMVSGYKKWFSLLISLAGSVLMGGVLISTISNIIERRVEDYQKGRGALPQNNRSLPDYRVRGDHVEPNQATAFGRKYSCWGFEGRG